MSEQNALVVQPQSGAVVAQDEMTPQMLVAQVMKIQEAMHAVMKPNQHFGVIPGTDKPTLLKPGAEKLSLLFRLAPSFEIRRQDWPGGHREYEVICTLKHITTDRVLGQGVGSCSTMEKKYRYRLGEPEKTDNMVPRAYWDLRKTDAAKAQALIGGKDFVTKKIDNLWWICKKSADRVENEDIADVYNTVLKMAKKRAQVDATLTATAASDIFTQDLEDLEQFADKLATGDDATAPQNQAGNEQKPAEDQRKAANGTRAPAQSGKPAPRPTMSVRQALWDGVLAYAGGDQRHAGKIIGECSLSAIGREERFYTKLTEEEAAKVQQEFEKNYSNTDDNLVPDGGEGGFAGAPELK